MKNLFRKIIIASHNRGKVAEIERLLDSLDCQFASAGDYNLSEPAEDGLTFEQNALIKARYVMQNTGEAALGDDSGLCIFDLDGLPAIYSARLGGENKDFALAARLIEIALQERGIEPTGAKAKFVCALALVSGDIELCVRGEVYGSLSFPAKGDKGFGYDPIFIPDGYDMTFAEMEVAAKEAISHRTRAFANLLKGI